MHFAHSYVLWLVALLDLDIVVVGGVGCAYICGCQLGEVFLDECVNICMCVFVEYSCVFCFVLCFVCFVVGRNSSTPNEEIVGFRCMVGEVIYPFVHICCEKFSIFVLLFFLAFVKFGAFVIGF